MDNRISRNEGKKKAIIIAISEGDNLPKEEQQLSFSQERWGSNLRTPQKQGHEILDDWKLIGEELLATN